MSGAFMQMEGSVLFEDGELLAVYDWSFQQIEVSVLFEDRELLAVHV